MIPAKAVRTMEEQGVAIATLLDVLCKQQANVARLLDEQRILLTAILSELKKEKK